jgi:hypothetical protein
MSKLVNSFYSPFYEAVQAVCLDLNAVFKMFL